MSLCLNPASLYRVGGTHLVKGTLLCNVGDDHVGQLFRGHGAVLGQNLVALGLGSNRGDDGMPIRPGLVLLLKGDGGGAYTLARGARRERGRR